MFIRWLINTIAILIAIKVVPGILYEGQWWGILVVSVIFGFINALIKPIVTFFTFPLLVLSLGLFTFVINALMLLLTSLLSAQFGLGFHVTGFKAAFLGALLISLVSMVLSCLMPPREQHPPDRIG